MILAKLSDSARYEGVHPALSMLFNYVKEHNLLSAQSGKLSLDDENLFINVVNPTLMTKEAQKLEVHRQYIDVHIPLSGPEIIGVRHISTLGEPDAPFNEEEDCAVYTAPATNYIVVEPGDFLLVFPEDAHAPIIGSGKLHKLIAKVKI